MSITLENSTNTIDFGSDSSLTRKAANALSTPGSLDAASLHVTGAGGLIFSDNSVQSTAAIVPTNVSAFTNDAGYLTSSAVLPVENTTFRYQMNSTTGQAVWGASTSTLFAASSWSRTGTSLVITRANHGHSTGDRVLLKNVNVAFLNALITATTTNTFTVTCADLGATSGSTTLYGLGFNFTHNAGAGSISSGSVVPPSGSFTNEVQLLSLRIHLAANTRSGTTYNLVTNAAMLNGLTGGSTNMDDIFVPLQQVRQDGTTLTAVGNTITTNISGSYMTFQFAALPAVTTGIHILVSF